MTALLDFSGVVPVWFTCSSRVLRSKSWKAFVVFMVETWNQTQLCASDWSAWHGHLSLEEKLYCKSKCKDIELDPSLNSSAE